MTVSRAEFELLESVLYPLVYSRYFAQTATSGPPDVSGLLPHETDWSER
jgi:hypothetical protein